jgi:transcriptional regulator with XRE-family HTH domain
MKNDLKKLVGKRVKALRKTKGLTQEELAELIDKTVETISNIERGVKLPGLATLEEIRKALGVNLSELIDTQAK